MNVAGWPVAFRGSDAVAAGLVSWGLLRGAGYQRVFPDTYVRSTAEPHRLELRSLAAYRWAQGRGAVVSGYSAAELLGASCGRADAPAEVTVAGHSLRIPPGLRLHRGALRPEEVTMVGDVRVTTPLRTAFDLARRVELLEAVVAVDALARVGEFEPDLLPRHRGARGVERLPEVLALADRRSGSPMETRLRLLLVQAGLPPPAVQHPVLDGARRRAVWLDLAYPDRKVGIEYDGAEHFTAERARHDTERHTRLAAAGWLVLRYTAHEVRHEPDRILREVRAALARPSGRAPGRE